jgi:hypothetical protein
MAKIPGKKLKITEMVPMVPVSINGAKIRQPVGPKFPLLIN